MRLKQFEMPAPQVSRGANSGALAALAFTGIVAAVFLGAITNAINGLVSPTYFVTILRWQDVQDVWRASIAQGVFEGLLFGLVFSVIFTTGIGLITKAACAYGCALRHLLGIVAGALGCWVLGGLAAMGLAALSPEFYRNTFIGVPDELGPMLAYAWVGGSIVGIQLGGFACLVIGLVMFRANWRRRDNQEALRHVES